MIRGSFWRLVSIVAGAAACAPPPAKPPPAPPPSAEPVVTKSATAEADPAPVEDAPPEAPAEPPLLPSSCAERLQLTKDDAACLPDPDFTKRLCAGSFPDVAISLNAKESPWTRAWLAGDVEAWNASGARFTNPEKLVFDEEVLILSRRAAPRGAVVISGAQATYDVMRWDGTCVSVQEGELRWKRPPAPKTAMIAWKNLDEPTKTALLASKWVKAARDAADKACASTDDATKRLACKNAEREASQAVGNALRTGLAVPANPSRRP